MAEKPSEIINPHCGRCNGAEWVGGWMAGRAEGGWAVTKDAFDINKGKITLDESSKSGFV